MKKLVLVSLFAFAASLFGSHASAQTYDMKKNNYIVLTRKVPQLKPIILSAAELAKSDGKGYGEFHVVICGQTVEDLRDHDKMKPFLDMAKKHNVKVIACGFSLMKFKVEESEIPDQMEVVKNGILYNFQLQKAGFYSITL